VSVVPSSPRPAIRHIHVQKRPGEALSKDHAGDLQADLGSFGELEFSRAEREMEKDERQDQCFDGAGDRARIGHVVAEVRTLVDAETTSFGVSFKRPLTAMFTQSVGVPFTL